MRKWYFLIFLIACGQSKEDSTLVHAANVHSEITKTGHRTSVGVAEMKRLESTMSGPQLDTLQVIIHDLSGWYESLVEVPGYEGDTHDHEGHGHNHEHSHNDNYLEGLTSSEILAIQLELKKEIDRIQGRTINLMNRTLSRDTIH